MQRQVDGALASGLGSSPGVSAAAAARVPGPAFSAAWPPLPVSYEPEQWTRWFVARLLDIDFSRQSRAGLGRWLQAEAAPELLAGVPASVQDKVLYLSLMDPTVAGGPSPIPSASRWRALAGAGVRTRVSDLLVQADPRWSKLLASGWEPTDVRSGLEDVPGPLRVTSGSSTTDLRFSLALYVGSAHWHPGYGIVLVDDWKVG